VRVSFPLLRREQQEACRERAVGSRKPVNVKSRLGWRPLTPSRIFVPPASVCAEASFKTPGRGGGCDRRQGSAASKSAEAVVSADLGSQPRQPTREEALLAGETGSTCRQAFASNPPHHLSVEFPFGLTRETSRKLIQQGDVMALPCHRAPRGLSPLCHLERLVHSPRERSAREPIFNAPVVVLWLLTAMGLVHAVSGLVLNDEQANAFLNLFAFVPARYDLRILHQFPWTVGWGAAVWTFVTYAFIHGNLLHLTFNGVWLLAFGTPVARRFGPLRFLIFFLFSAAVGACVYLAAHAGERVLMVGASAAISGAMAATLRFAFQRGGPLAALRSDDDAAYRVPAASLSVMFQDPRIIAFVAAWMVGNLLSGLGGDIFLGDMPIAWEAHIGGFLAGLLTFRLFDPTQVDVPSEESIKA
jgi:membrane associated rhomboid family serine protease